MGLIYSILCSVTFCIERVLTWTCCSLLLVLLMFTVVTLMFYGIAVGYRYAQKEIEFTSGYKPWYWPEWPLRRDAGAGGRSAGNASLPGLRLAYSNLTALSTPNSEMYATLTPLEMPGPAAERELSPHQIKELARRLIRRFRRSRDTTAAAEPFLRPLRASNVTGNSFIWPLT